MEPGSNLSRRCARRQSGATGGMAIRQPRRRMPIGGENRGGLGECRLLGERRVQAGEAEFKTQRRGRGLQGAERLCEVSVFDETAVVAAAVFSWIATTVILLRGGGRLLSRAGENAAGFNTAMHGGGRPDGEDGNHEHGLEPRTEHQASNLRDDGAASSIGRPLVVAQRRVSVSPSMEMPWASRVSPSWRLYSARARWWSISAR